MVTVPKESKFAESIKIIANTTKAIAQLSKIVAYNGKSNNTLLDVIENIQIFPNNTYQLTLQNDKNLLTNVTTSIVNNITTIFSEIGLSALPDVTLSSNTDQEDIPNKQNPKQNPKSKAEQLKEEEEAKKAEELQAENDYRASVKFTSNVDDLCNITEKLHKLSENDNPNIIQINKGSFRACTEAFGLGREGVRSGSLNKDSGITATSCKDLFTDLSSYAQLKYNPDDKNVFADQVQYDSYINDVGILINISGNHVSQSEA